MPLDDWRLLLWRKALGEQHACIADEIYVKWLCLRYKYLAPSDEVITLLEVLRKNYYLAVISNGKSSSQWEKLTRLGLIPYFDSIFVSGDLPWEKPSKEIFLNACRQLGVRPEECIMVGDKPETDILGAAEAGLAASVWIPVSEPGFTTGNCHVEPDYTIKNVLDLSYLINEIPKSSCPDLEDCNSNSSDGS